MRILPADGQFGRAPVTQTPVREYCSVANTSGVPERPPGIVTSIDVTPTGMVTLPDRLSVTLPVTDSAVPVVATARTPIPVVVSPRTPWPSVDLPNTPRAVSSWLAS